MAYEHIDLETPQPSGKVGEPGPTAWAKARRMFVELYKLWQTNPNVFPYFDKDGNPTFSALTEFARSIMDDSDASTVLKTLGVSEFAKTLLDDASASAVLDTLGAGATGKNLFAAANQAGGRSALGLGSVAIMSTLGTAVSGGASGAVIERGSNSNGDYVRFADGTQLCWGNSSSLRTCSTQAASGGFYFSGTTDTLTFPAAFASVPKVTCYTTGQVNYFSWAGNNSSASTTNTGSLIICSGLNGAQAYIGYVAVGRWY